MNQRNNNYINLDILPKKMGFGSNKNLVIDWMNCAGIEVDFKYETKEGLLKIISYDKKERKLFLSYENKEYKLSTESFRNCQLISIFKMKPIKYKYEIGKIIEIPSGKIKIIGYGRQENNKKIYICECLECHNEINKTESQLNNKETGCAYCSGRYAINGISDMWTTDPIIASWLLDKNDGYLYKVNSNIKLNWRCPDCGNIIYDKTPNAVKRYNKLSCPECSKTKSYPNRLMYTLLKSLGVNFKAEKSFDWSKDGMSVRRYDFYLIDFNILCEMHGRQHYDNGFITSYEEIHKIDLYKKEIALNNGISEYIEINCIKSELKLIKNNIVNSKLSEIIDFSKVNWEEVDRLSQHSLMIDTCNLWNSGIKNRKELCEIIGVSPECIYSYLKHGKSLGICNYNKKESIKIGRKQSVKTLYQNNAKPIICVENKMVFGSVGVCEDNSQQIFGINIDRHCIKRTIIGKQKTAQGFTFQYITKEQFNEIKSNPITEHLAFGDFFILNDNNIKQDTIQHTNQEQAS